MSVEESFESPRLLVSAAREDFNKLVTASQAYLRGKPQEFVAERKPGTTTTVCYLKVVKQPPPQLRVLTYRVVNDLRNALDQTVFGASQALGQKKLDRTFFPFRNNPRDLEHVFVGNGMCSDVPAELHDTLRSFEPYPRGDGYPGGDNGLRAFGHISNPNKHSVALRVGVTARGMDIGRIAGKGLMSVTGAWNSTKTKFVLFTVGSGADVDYKINVPTFIAFDKTSLDGAPVLAFLEDMIAKVTGIIDTLEAKTREILAARA